VLFLLGGIAETTNIQHFSYACGNADADVSAYGICGGDGNIDHGGAAWEKER
jgi:hypothetical protein